MEQPLSQRPIALVIGGAQRVGKTVVEHLRHKGFRVLFTFRTARPGSAWLEDADALQFDLKNAKTTLGGLAARVSSEADRLDLLLNCASKYEPDPTDATEMFNVNHTAVVATIRAFAPLLGKAKGSVVNMLDIQAERPMPSYATYCASKAALWNSTLSLARELAPSIRVNGIAPGVVEWPPGMPESEKTAYLKRVPLARAGTPEDVARLVHFLATEGTYITGQVIRLDGGRSIV